MVTLQQEQEEDGRWLAEAPEIPGVLAYGATAKEAARGALSLALRVLAESLENGEIEPQAVRIVLGQEDRPWESVPVSKHTGQSDR